MDPLTNGRLFLEIPEQHHPQRRQAVWGVDDFNNQAVLDETKLVSEKSRPLLNISPGAPHLGRDDGCRGPRLSQF